MTADEFLTNTSRVVRCGAVGLFLFLAACSVPQSRPFPSPSTTTPNGAGLTQTGIASWYGPGFHGRPTASGVIYDQNEMTAAHQTLPLGTRVMVTNLENGRATELVINDRGPFAKGRILDLSYGAGEALGMIKPGTIPVRIEVIQAPYKMDTIRSSLDWTLQLGSFSQLENAQQLRDRLAKSLSDVNIVPLQMKNATFYRVQVGNFSDRATAEEQAKQLTQNGFPVMILEK
ncbi:MAG TPA: septal ring lytic transglycosylase RlpA family protein [Candidatus Binatia bacterium]|jgi:rare lipoprotein A